MRALITLAALAFGFHRASAQAPAAVQPPAAKQAPADTAALSREIAKQRAAGDTRLPDADHFTFGDRVIAAGTRVDGPIAVARGNLDVYGTVQGDVAVLDGDIHVHRGARVAGDVWAAAGRVIIDGGIVEGQKRAVNVRQAFVPTPAGPPLGTWGSIKLTIGWFAILMIIGLGVMVFAEGNLDGVVIALERGFARAFWIGLAGQLLALPGLLVLVVALAITVIGSLLIPFAIVAYVIAAAGLVTLGFLSVARLTGGAFASDRGTTSPRGVHLRALFIGLVAYCVVWLVAAAFAWSPVMSAILRPIAIAITWVAATVGLGATIASRGGTVRPGVGTGKATTDEFAWQTPTPVTGVAAATRRVANTR
jgi:Polymer-forming cytoskeletal